MLHVLFYPDMCTLYLPIRQDFPHYPIALTLTLQRGSLFKHGSFCFSLSDRSVCTAHTFPQTVSSHFYAHKTSCLNLLAATLSPCSGNLNLDVPPPGPFTGDSFLGSGVCGVGTGDLGRDQGLGRDGWGVEGGMFTTPFPPHCTFPFCPHHFPHPIISAINLL